MRALLIQLPIPKSNFGLKTGNIPFGAACLKQAAAGIQDAQVEILDPLIASHGSDALILDHIIDFNPDILGFTVFCWNLDRSLYLAKEAKAKTGTRVILGGPEITRDFPATHDEFIDLKICGQGEEAFRQLLMQKGRPSFDKYDPSSSGPVSGRIFEQSPSPYTEGVLSPGQGDAVLLETQRGCPFGCRFCHYNKSMAKLVFKETGQITRTLAWARQNNISEIVFLDPTLNGRPNLAALLERIKAVNPPPQIALSSEIRAERIDDHIACLLRLAGFTEFEIGLQSIHPLVLENMGRKTDLGAFLSGVKALKAQGIRTRIDLIVGLPGDTLEGFLASLDFVMENGLEDDIQVFPLLVLPGTYFRKHAESLGLVYDSHPPYTIIETPDFSAQDMTRAFDIAEARLDLALIPMPHLDIAYKKRSGAGDVPADLCKKQAISKVVLTRPRSEQAIKNLARNLTAPYQIFICNKSPEHHLNAITILTAASPFTPVEIVFIQPETIPDTRIFLDAARIRRPHFLDKDLEILHPAPGNRAVMFTLVSDQLTHRFTGEMERQIFYWTRPQLPDLFQIERLSHLDGILIDNAEDNCRAWQDLFSKQAESLPQISFAHTNMQQRWKALTGAGDWEV